MPQSSDDKMPSVQTAQSEPVRPTFGVRSTVEVHGLGDTTRISSSQLPYQDRAADRAVLDRNFAVLDRHEQDREPPLQAVEPAASDRINTDGLLTKAATFVGQAFDMVAGYFENLFSPPKAATPGADYVSDRQEMPAEEQINADNVHAERQREMVDRLARMYPAENDAVRENRERDDERGREL